MMQHGELWGIPEPRKLRDLVLLSFLARFPQLSGDDCKRISFSALAVQIAHDDVNTEAAAAAAAATTTRKDVVKVWLQINEAFLRARITIFVSRSF
jgi:hypothetical protein